MLGWHFAHIGNLHGCAIGCCLADSGITADADMPFLDRRDQSVVHPVGGPQFEFLSFRVEHVDRACFSLRELDRLGHNRGKDGFQIERRVDCLADIAERPKLFDRFRKLFGSHLHLVEQANVLDGDHGLVGENCDKLDLLGSERPRYVAGHRHHADAISISQKRDGQNRAIVGELLGFYPGIIGIS